MGRPHEHVNTGAAETETTLIDGKAFKVRDRTRKARPTRTCSRRWIYPTTGYEDREDNGNEETRDQEGIKVIPGDNWILSEIYR